jgi:hypothetical protein
MPSTPSAFVSDKNSAPRPDQDQIKSLSLFSTLRSDPIGSCPWNLVLGPRPLRLVLGPISGKCDLKLLYNTVTEQYC